LSALATIRLVESPTGGCRQGSRLAGFEPPKVVDALGSGSCRRAVRSQHEGWLAVVGHDNFSLARNQELEPWKAGAQIANSCRSHS
jgi:hypothetical protein